MKTIYEHLDLGPINKELEPLSAVERIRWADEQFGDDLWALTSGGIDSPVLPHLLQQAGVEVRFLHINTGVAFPETLPFVMSLAAEYGLSVRTYFTQLGELSDEEAQGIFDANPDGYREVTKLEPMRRAVKESGITAILSGVRADQTENRANLDYIKHGNDGELRIHPILDWSEYKISEFSAEEGLLLHPLADRYGSVGDRITTVPGEGREGRLEEHSECGLHLPLSREQNSLQTS